LGIDFLGVRPGFRLYSEVRADLQLFDLFLIYRDPVAQNIHPIFDLGRVVKGHQLAFLDADSLNLAFFDFCRLFDIGRDS
jgi:hypothetical protein